MTQGPSQERRLFEAGSGAPKRRGAPAPADQEGDEDRPRDLRCSVCRAPITAEIHRLDRGGGHDHTFVNPGGFVHHVRCFGVAHGVAELGTPQTAFSWFPGYAWQVLDCRRCRVHIGWRFRGVDDQFYGLVAERLVEG